MQLKLNETTGNKKAAKIAALIGEFQGNLGHLKQIEFA